MPAPAAVGKLMASLCLSGLAMSVAGTSAPASGGEHLISHYIEMMTGGPPTTFHGEQIAVTTLTMARLHERLLAGAPPTPRATRTTEADLVAHFGPDLGAVCWPELAAKRLDEAAAEKLRERISERWDLLRERIAEHRALSPEVMASVRAFPSTGHPMAAIQAGLAASPEEDFHRGI